MTWNLLNYPDNSNFTPDTTLRNPYYRAVIQYEYPQIVVTQENANATNSVNLFLNGVMNNVSIGGGNQFSAGTFINGFDTDNAIYYRTNFFQFISNTPIHTGLRDINEFKLVHISTGDTLRIYSCHLKAGNTSADSIDRGAEVDNLRAITNALPAGTDFIVCGDFNIYATGETAYQKLKQNNPNDDGNFIDPLNLTGTWNYFGYSQYHTQSTRTRSFGNGSTGGLDDRFDMILYSTAVSQTGGVKYVPGSTIAVGNDSYHYNDSINQQPNSALPVYVANALHYASDHLPVTSVFTFTSTTGLEDIELQNINLNISPNPTTGSFYINYFIAQPANIIIDIYDVTGKIVKQFQPEQQLTGNQSMQITDADKLHAGVYFVRLQMNEIPVAGKLLVIQ